MISICCCAINAKHDVDQFVRLLHLHNPDSDFEICLVHDNRVDDGSAEHFAALATEFPRLRVLTRTHEDAVDYLEKLLRYYHDQQLFESSYRQILETNLAKFARRELFDHARSLLWLSSGHLYNLAVGMARGENLVVTPADFLYLFRLNRLEELFAGQQRHGEFYAKPWASWLRIGNHPRAWLQEHLHDVHAHRSLHNIDDRMDSARVIRDLFRASTNLEDYYLLDFRHTELHPLSADNLLDVAVRMNYEAADQRTHTMIPNFHGMHFMTKTTYHKIGGFSEAYHGRAFADDTMTWWGHRQTPGHQILPVEFSVAWVPNHERLDDHESHAPDAVQRFAETYPYYGRHPLPPVSPVYLHQQVDNDAEQRRLADTAKYVQQYLHHSQPPVRLLD